MSDEIKGEQVNQGMKGEKEERGEISAKGRRPRTVPQNIWKQREWKIWMITMVRVGSR